MICSYVNVFITVQHYYFFQAASEQPNGYTHQRENTAVPLIWYKTPEDEMINNDDCDLQNDQRDGSSDVMHSTVMDSEHVNVKEDNDELLQWSWLR